MSLPSRAMAQGVARQRVQEPFTLNDAARKAGQVRKRAMQTNRINYAEVKGADAATKAAAAQNMKVVSEHWAQKDRVQSARRLAGMDVPARKVW